MEIFFDNPLANMYGPYFLIFYGFLIFFSVVALALFKTKYDRTDRLNLPSIPSNIDPFEVAYLRGGRNEMARAVIFSLLQKGFLEIKNDGKNSEIKSVLNPQNQYLPSRLEKRALDWFYTTRQPKEIFASSGLAGQLDDFGQNYQIDLERRQFLTSKQTEKIFSPVKWAFILMILALGIYKTVAALAHAQSNLILLALFGVGGVVMANAVSKLPRLTKLGKVYLERLQTAFETLKYTSQKPYISTNQSNFAAPATFGSVDPLLLSVGVFGSGILAGTVFDNYNQAFHRAQISSAGGSSCGSAGCGSCSSGGGSSDGGSSCGGGCGGCGGGCS